MICAISRFRVANGMEAAVCEAFARRPGVVDRQPGFLSMEVYTDSRDDALFYLVTRWTDEISFHTWPRSPAHRESHQGMPRGLKLDPAQTRLFVMNRIPSGARALGLEPVVADAAPFAAEFLHDAQSAVLIAAAADGKVHACNAAAARMLCASGPAAAGGLLWDALAEEDAGRLRARISSGERQPRERFVLHAKRGGPALDCRLDLHPAGFLLLGEFARGADETVLNEMTKINNEVVAMARESARKEQALAHAHAALEEKNAALEQANRRITELSRTDALTGLWNRRYFDEVFAAEVTRAARSRTALSVMMVDLDHFKSVNDEFGHGVGDVVLAAAAATLKASSRPYDIVARYGGEEFVVALPGTAGDEAAACAERMRAAIAAAQIPGYPRQVTASLGVACLTESGDGASLLERADAALYRAKAGGRNRVAHVSPDR